MVEPRIVESDPREPMAEDTQVIITEDNEPRDAQTEESLGRETDRLGNASPRASPALQTPGAGGDEDVGQAASASPWPSLPHSRANDDADQAQGEHGHTPVVAEEEGDTLDITGMPACQPRKGTSSSIPEGDFFARAWEGLAQMEREYHSP